MSKIKLIAAAAVLALTIPAVAVTQDRLGNQAAPLDTRAFPNLTQIYVASGVRDNGAAANTGVATTILCTNFTGATQQIRFLIRDFTGAAVANETFGFQSLSTGTVSTHATVAYVEAVLSPGTVITHGSLRIFATAPQITCTAVVIDASTVAPVGTNLHLVRHNPWPGTQE